MLEDPSIDIIFGSSYLPRDKKRFISESLGAHANDILKIY